MRGKKIENLRILKEHGFQVPEFIYLNKEDEIKGLQIPWEISAVRSCAGIEDSENDSFAGQFDTYLNVPKAEIESKVQECFASMRNENVTIYAKQRGIEEPNKEMGVIVQKMIQSQYSGVCFTANPQGLLNEMVVVVGKGTGDNVVEDKVDTTTYYYNITDKIYYYEGSEDYLSDGMIEKLVEVASKMQLILGNLLDIEFAVEEEKLYILQARKITTLSDEYQLIMDNSNIVESYPGLSLPLTCSFVNVVYSGIFRSVSKRVLKNDKILSRYEDVFRNMVGSVNGRIYYKISNWYTIIKFLPMNRKLIPIWQDMMGVRNRSYDRQDVKLSPIDRIRTYWNVIWEMAHVSANMEKLNEDFKYINKQFYEKYRENITAKELIALYQELYQTLLSCWDVTLLNDIYAFVFTGILKKRLGESSNQVISGISNIESLKPIQELVKLAYEKNQLSEEAYKIRKQEYIKVYGDRNLEELKLESKTFRSHPELLEEIIQQYNEDATKLKEMYENLHKNNKETKTLHGFNGFLAKKAAKGIANREVSRLNRSRIFGIVRLMFTKMGEIYAKQVYIDQPQDIFWLTIEEAFSLADTAQKMQDIVLERKKQYEIFTCLPAYQRLIFAKEEFDKHHRSVNAHEFITDCDKYMGVPCSDGVAEGEVLVVRDVTAVKDYKDKILVTKMTDPGWVFLLVKAKGVISEKGSLLSHTAIISRELKIPSVVGVEGILNTLKTGDRIRMNGNTGMIEILERV